MSFPTIPQLFDLTGKTFLVSGGARNLGRDMATALCEAGASGVLTSRNEESAQQTARELCEATGSRVLGFSLDATDEADVQRVVQKTLEEFGRIDILINNTGGGGGAQLLVPMNLEERPREIWDAVQVLNVTAPFLVCKHVTPVMKEQGSGSIINIASIAGLIGRDRRVYQGGMLPQPVDYAAAKAAVLGMTRDMAAYLGEHGIRVNAISPGGFFRETHPREFVDAYSDKTPLRRMGRDGIDLKGAAVFWPLTHRRM